MILAAASEASHEIGGRDVGPDDERAERMMRQREPFVVLGVDAEHVRDAAQHA